MLVITILICIVVEKCIVICLFVALIHFLFYFKFCEFNFQVDIEIGHNRYWTTNWCHTKWNDYYNVRNSFPISIIRVMALYCYAYLHTIPTGLNQTIVISILKTVTYHIYIHTWICHLINSFLYKIDVRHSYTVRQKYVYFYNYPHFNIPNWDSIVF